MIEKIAVHGLWLADQTQRFQVGETVATEIITV